LKRPASEAAFGQEKGRRRPGACMDEPAAPDGETRRPRRAREVIRPPGREDETGPAIRFEESTRGLHNAKNIAFYLMLCNGFLGFGAQKACRLRDIGGIAENDVELSPGPEKAEVGPDNGDPALEPVQADVPAGEAGEQGLNFHRREMGKAAHAQEQGDDPAPRAELQKLVGRPDSNEIGQKGGVEGEPVSALFLEDEDAAPIEGIQGFVGAGGAGREPPARRA